MQTSNDKGYLAEVAVALHAARLGIPALLPWSGHARYDLVFDVRGALLRVQCKWARLERGGSVISVRCGGSRHAPRGYVRSTYASDEFDLLGIYCRELDRCYLLPIELVSGKHQVQLRLRPPGNGQRSGVILAEQYQFDGAIAQLGERSAGSRKVAGSNPASSTSSAAGGELSPLPSWAAEADVDTAVISAHELRERFGYWMDRAAAGGDIVVTRRGRKQVRLVSAAQAVQEDRSLTTLPV